MIKNYKINVSYYIISYNHIILYDLIIKLNNMILNYYILILDIKKYYIINNKYDIENLLI